MSDVQMTIKVPSELLQYGYDQELLQQRVREWLVISLFTEGRISSGKAARLLGIPRVEFLDLLRKHKVAYLDYTPQELAEEFEAVRQLKVEGNA